MSDKSMAPREILDRPGDPDFMQSLARGLAVLNAVVHARAPVSVVELASATGLPRAAVRRCIHTLRLLEYVGSKEGGTVSGPRLASLAATYSGSSALIQAAQPILNRLRDDLGHTVSLGILDGGEAIYLARATNGRRWHTDVPLGGKVPAYCTALGRVLLANRPNPEISAYLALGDFVARTPKTVTSPERLRTILEDVHLRGHAIVDQELEVGLRAVAVPVRDGSGQVVAAINIATQPALVGLRELRGKILGAALAASHDLKEHLA